MRVLVGGNMDKSSGPKASPPGRWDSQERPQRTEPTSSEFEVFIGNLSWGATEDDIRRHFETCGHTVRVKVLTSPDGRSKGIAFVGFENAEAVEAALKLTGSEFMGRQLKVNKAGERPARREARPETNVVFVGNVSYNCTEDDIRAMFTPCGDIKTIRLAKGEDGRPKGFAHIEFEDPAAAGAAVALNGSELKERKVRVDFAEQKSSGGRGRGRGGRGRGMKQVGTAGTVPVPSAAPAKSAGGWD